MFHINNNVIVSRLVTNSDIKTYLEVEGKPFLYNAIQSWYPPEKDYSLYMEKTAEVNCKVFTFWLCWRNLEPEQGVYCWTELEKVIDLANNHDLRLDIVWAGTNFCGHADPRFTPDWVLDYHPWHLKDNKLNCKELSAFDLGTCHAIDYKNLDILEIEKAFVSVLMEHIRNYDQNHRVILFQVENEVNINDWTGQAKEEVLNYCNEIGGAVKAGSYKIATRINLVNKDNDVDVNNLSNIDFHGPDPYSDDSEEIRKIIDDTDNSRMPYIAENAAYENSSKLMVLTFAHGGFYNIYRLDYDSIWKKPGVFGENWSYWSVTYKIQNLNKALNKIGALIAESPKSKMIEIIVDKGISERKTLSGIGFELFCEMNSEFRAALVVKKQDDFYFISDDDVTICVDFEPTACETGSFNDIGLWTTDYSKTLKKESNNANKINYKKQECLKIVFNHIH